MSDLTVRRGERGHLLPGSVLNPGGRPRGAIQEVRELLGPHTPEFVAALVELARSPNEATRLAAIREAFDRLLGKAPLAVDGSTSDAMVTNIQQLYLTAVQEANRQPDPPVPIDVTPASGARDDATTEW